MSKSLAIILTVLGVSIFIIVIALTQNIGGLKTEIEDIFSGPPPATPTPLPTAVPLPPSGFHRVTITESGFDPAELTVTVGSEVRFLNSDSEEHWPQTEPDRLRRDFQVCREFESINSAIQPQQLYALQFDEPRICEYFDKLNSELRGTLIVR